ncbi:MAG: MFS transporter [Eggerthella lenta]
MPPAVAAEEPLAIIAFIWAGQAASMITSYAAGYAVVWYVTESTGSALMLAAMNIAVMLPVGLTLPFGGIVADKHNRKLIMISRRSRGHHLTGGGTAYSGWRCPFRFARRLHRTGGGPSLPQSGDGGHAHARA